MIVDVVIDVVEDGDSYSPTSTRSTLDDYLFRSQRDMADLFSVFLTGVK